MEDEEQESSQVGVDTHGRSTIPGIGEQKNPDTEKSNMNADVAFSISSQFLDVIEGVRSVLADLIAKIKSQNQSNGYIVRRGWKNSAECETEQWRHLQFAYNHLIRPEADIHDLLMAIECLKHSDIDYKDRPIPWGTIHAECPEPASRKFTPIIHPGPPEEDIEALAIECGYTKRTEPVAKDIVESDSDTSMNTPYEQDKIFCFDIDSGKGIQYSKEELSYIEFRNDCPYEPDFGKDILVSDIPWEYIPYEEEPSYGDIEAQLAEKLLLELTRTRGYSTGTPTDKEKENLLSKNKTRGSSILDKDVDSMALIQDKAKAGSDMVSDTPNPEVLDTSNADSLKTIKDYSMATREERTPKAKAIGDRSTGKITEAKAQPEATRNQTVAIPAPATASPAASTPVKPPVVIRVVPVAPNTYSGVTPLLKSFGCRLPGEDQESYDAHLRFQEEIRELLDKRSQ